jgi:hypothetical protein
MDDHRRSGRIGAREHSGADCTGHPRQEPGRASGRDLGPNRALAEAILDVAHSFAPETATALTDFGRIRPIDQRNIDDEIGLAYVDVPWRRRAFVSRWPREARQLLPSARVAVGSLVAAATLRELLPLFTWITICRPWTSAVGELPDFPVPERRPDRFNVPVRYGPRPTLVQPIFIRARTLEFDEIVALASAHEAGDGELVAAEEGIVLAAEAAGRRWTAEELFRLADETIRKRVNAFAEKGDRRLIESTAIAAGARDALANAAFARALADLVPETPGSRAGLALLETAWESLG